jgi:uncharacterized repeat protein (TIGR03803 family)
VPGADGRLYGVASYGGARKGGTFFRMSIHGRVTVLHAFGRRTVDSPRNLMRAADGNFYATGDLDRGETELFRLTPKGRHRTVYTSPSDDNDCLRWAGITALLQGRDGHFYIANAYSLTDGNGCITRVSRDGQATLLHRFQGDDGGRPSSLLESGDGFFYGLTYRGGKFGHGTFFRMDRDGRVDVLHDFARHRDGITPQSLLEGPDGHFYGVTLAGGVTPYAGTVFRVSRQGDFSVLHHFARETDGKGPESLTLGRDGQLYGLTSERYVSDRRSTAFRLSLDGAFSVLHRFDDTAQDEHVESHGMTEMADGHFYWVSLGDLESVAYQLRLAP